MKKLVWLVCVGWLGVVGLACSAEESTPVAQSSAALTEAEIGVEGMVCGGCERAIAERLKSVDGVADVAADQEKALASVKFDPNKVRLETLVAAINELGYKAHIAAPAAMP